MPSYKLDIIVNAKDNASRALGGIGKVIGGLGKAAMIGLGAVSAVAAGTGIAIARMAINAAPLENVRAAFEGITAASGKSGDAILAALKKGSAGMISQGDLMKSYNTAAQLVGTTFANQLPDAMGYLTKVSAATGQDMGYMLDSLVRGVGRLSPLILDNLGIQVSLAEAAERASEMFGVETDELTKAQQQAGMMNVAMEKLAVNTAAMPDVIGTAAASMASLKTTFQDTKDAIGLAFLPVLNTVVGVLQELWATHGPAVMATVQQVADIVGVLAERFIAFIAGAGNFDWMSLIPPAAIGLFWSLQGLLDRLAEWWKVNGPGITATAQVLGETLITAFQDLATNVLPWLAEKLDEFGIWFTDNGPLIQQFVAVVAEAFGILVEQTVLAWEWIEPILDLLISGFFNVGTLIMQMVTGDWAGAWLTAETILYDTIEGFQLAFTELADWVTGWFGSDWASVMAQWSTNWELFSVIATTAWDNITTAIENAISKIKGWIDAFVAKLQSVTLPSWLQGHSPPPLANWLDDISTSIQGVAKADLSGALSVAPGGAGSSSSQVTNNYRFDQTVNTRASTHSIMNDWALAQALAP